MALKRRVRVITVGEDGNFSMPLAYDLARKVDKVLAELEGDGVMSVQFLHDATHSPRSRYIAVIVYRATEICPERGVTDA